MTTKRYAYSTLLVRPDGYLLRVVTSAIHPTWHAAAIAAELDAPPERTVEWLDEDELAPLDGWLIGTEATHAADGEPYFAPVMVHPSTATDEDIRRTWNRWLDLAEERRIVDELNADAERTGAKRIRRPNMETKYRRTPTLNHVGPLRK